MSALSCSRCKKQDVRLIKYAKMIYKGKTYQYYMCLPCNTERASKYRSTEAGKEAHKRAYEKVDKEKRKQYLKKYNVINKEKIAITRRANYDKHKQAQKWKIYNEQNPGKTLARGKVARHIAKGLLIRPSRCQSCKRESKTQAHHHKGYSLENALKVIFLCTQCHYSEHNS